MEVTFKGKECQLVGNPPKVGEKMPEFTVINKNGPIKIFWVKLLSLV